MNYVELLAAYDKLEEDRNNLEARVNELEEWITQLYDNEDMSKTFTRVQLGAVASNKGRADRIKAEALRGFVSFAYKKYNEDIRHPCEHYMNLLGLEDLGNV